MDIHEASPDELREAHQNVFDVWSKGLSLEAHLERRMTSAHHNWARWYVGLVDGKVVTALAAHPLELAVDREVLPAIGVASVHTLAEFRGRGLAPRLIAWVEHHERQRGAAASLLFSDVDPGYYARQGYTLGPAHEAWAAALPIDGQRGPLDSQVERLEPFAGRAGLGRMIGLWNECHGARGLRLERSSPYWELLFDRRPQDEFYWYFAGGATPAGYLRLTRRGKDLSISDWAVTHGDAARLGSLLALARRLAGELRAERVGGWLPDWPEVARQFQVTPRREEITMLKWLVPGRAWTPEQVAAADTFCEIDHV